MTSILEKRYKELADTQPRFQKAIATLAAQDIPFTDLVDECCRSCALAGDAIKEGSTGAYAWTFIGQDPKIAWVDGALREFEEREPVDPEEYDEDEAEELAEAQKAWSPIWLNGPVPKLNIYYGTTSETEPDLAELDVATKVAAAFKAEGFDVEWDGTTKTSISLVLAPDFIWPPV